MSHDPLPTFDEYVEWALHNTGIEFSETVKNFYNANSKTARYAVQEHEFFANLNSFIFDLDAQLLTDTSSSLLMSKEPLVLVEKSYDSVLNKIYRYNVITNRSFPEPPRDGWITPLDLYHRLNDIIRGTIVCKYIDGPGYLAQKLDAYAKGLGLKSGYNSQQRDVGYYAYHFYVEIPVELLGQGGTTFLVNLKVEIQLTTQLQEVLYQITHKHYEAIRDQIPSGDPSAWKWEVDSNRFRAGYLGHTLHLLEAIILDLRDADKTAKNDNNGEE